MDECTHGNLPGRRSRLSHGDCNSGDRGPGRPADQSLIRQAYDYAFPLYLLSESVNGPGDHGGAGRARRSTTSPTHYRRQRLTTNGPTRRASMSSTRPRGELHFKGAARGWIDYNSFIFSSPGLIPTRLTPSSNEVR